MSASLALADAAGRTRRVRIQSDTLLIGRDPACAVPIASEHASWHHAVIRRDGRRYVLEDLGSTNGTTVNGAPVATPVELNPGDHVLFGGDLGCIFLAGEDASGLRLPGGPIVLALLVVVAIATAAAFVLLRPTDEADPAMSAAAELARDGIRFARENDRARARAALKEAAGLLYTAGYLDEVPRGDLQREAMRMLQSELDVSFDLSTYYVNTLARVEPPPSAGADEPTRRCRLDAVKTSLLEPCLEQWIEHVMVEIRQDPLAVPSDFHRQVGARLRIEHEFLERAIARGKDLVPMLREELEAARMPPLLHYVALIESGYKNGATSTARAAGVWQFMPGTGRQYGLKVGGGVDERRDPEKATRAAARYLRDLAFEFGGDALLLALAGYNRGENGVRRSLKRLEDPFSDRSYWRLVDMDLLPQETQNYVPRFIAAAVAGEGGLPSLRALEAAGY